MTTPMKPSLCIVNYNGKRYLRDTLLAAQRCADELHETIVFDNASDDGSAEMAESEFPEVQVIRLGENRGPAPARNAAIDRAESDRIVIIDNDVRIEPGCATLLIQALDDNKNAVLAMPSVIFAHQPDTVQFDGADNHFLGQQILHSENRPVADEGPVRVMDSLITACFAVERSRLPHDMRFDESFFIYFEDHDFGVRARLYGKEVLSVPQAHCLHDEGTEGLSLRQLGKYSSMRVFCIIRNRWLFLLRNYSGKTLLLLAPLMLIYELAQLVIAIKKGWLGEWWKSVRWIFGNWSEIREKRRIVQTGRVLSDRAIMKGGPLPFREELIGSRFEALGRRVLDGMVVLYWRFLRRVA
jgi:GT2 family glycosyltransferase